MLILGFKYFKPLTTTTLKSMFFNTVCKKELTFRQRGIIYETFIHDRVCVRLLPCCGEQDAVVVLFRGQTEYSVMLKNGGKLKNWRFINEQTNNK